MSPEVLQLIFAAAGALIGWFVRHRLGDNSGQGLPQELLANIAVVETLAAKAGE